MASESEVRIFNIEINRSSFFWYWLSLGVYFLLLLALIAVMTVQQNNSAESQKSSKQNVYAERRVTVRDLEAIPRTPKTWDRAKLEICYQEAQKALYSRQFHTAAELFIKLDDYGDSKSLLDYALKYEAQEPEFAGQMIDDQFLKATYSGGKLYSLSNYGMAYGNTFKYKGMFYIPDSIDENTAFVQYYAGGGAGEDYLWYYGVYEYFKIYSPNAIIVFTNDSGCNYIETRDEFQWDILRQLAYECGTIVHDVSTIGSSQGCYTAMRAVYDFLQYGVNVNNCVTLDTGCYWETDSIALTREQCDFVSEAGVHFYLLEEEEFYRDLWKPAIRNVLDSGVPSFAVICRNGQHNTVSQNAYFLGVFSFTADRTFGLPPYEYCVLEMAPGDYELGEITWTDIPEDCPYYVHWP